MWCLQHHLPYIPCQILILQHIGLHYSKDDTMPPFTQSLADSLLLRDALTSTMFSYSEIQDKEDVNTKIEYRPHSGWDPSALFPPFSTLCRKVFFQSIIEACPSQGSYLYRGVRAFHSLCFFLRLIILFAVYGDHEPTRGEAIG